MPKYNEFKSCCALNTWWIFYSRVNKIPEHLFMHIANQSAGGARHGRNLKNMGVRSGIPDYLLAMPRGTYHGLWIEQKTEDGRVRPEQKIAMQDLQSQGYAVAVCRSTDEARTIIESYLK